METILVIIICSISLISLIVYNILKRKMLQKFGEGMEGVEEFFAPPNDIFLQIRSIINDGNHNVAQKLAKKHLKLNVEDNKLRLLLAKSFISTSNFEEAIEQLKILYEKLPRKIDVAILLANSYKSIGNGNAAIDIYLKLLQLNSDNPDFLVPLADLYSSTNHKNSALNIYKKLLIMEKNKLLKLEYYYKIASIYRDLNDVNNAIVNINDALEIDSKNIKALSLLEDLYSKTNKQDKRLELLEKLMILVPHDPHLQYETILIYFNNQQYEKALNVAFPALETENADVELIQDIIAKIYMKQNKFFDSISILESALKHNPNSIKLSITLIEAYKNNKMFENAVELYNILIKSADVLSAKTYKENLSKTYLEWANFLIETGNTRDAFDMFDEASKADVNNPEIYFGMAKLNFKIKNYVSAYQYIKKAVSLASSETDYRLFQGDIALKLGDLKEAEIAYKSAIFIEPNHHLAQSKLNALKNL